MAKKDAFDIGYAAGMNAALRGEAEIPAPPPFVEPNQKDFALEFTEGAELGFVRGQERVALIRNKAIERIEKSQARE